MPVAHPPTDPLAGLGMSLTGAGGEMAVFSRHAEGVELCLFDPTRPDRLIERITLQVDETGVWRGTSSSVVPGMPYALRVSGPTGETHRFDSDAFLLDPYARGIVHTSDGGWRSVVVAGDFDWGETRKPRTGLDRTVIYEAHVKGLSKLHPDVPEHLRGTYAGLANEAMTGYLTDLGVTAVELLPVHCSASEQRLSSRGLVNYWGYNTVGFFAPNPAYATAGARERGPAAVLEEFKGMVAMLHEAGLEVILDVVYNHTAEEGDGGPILSLRGIDNAVYYRMDESGRYIDETGCGNTLNLGHPVPQRLVLDSLRYWADEVQVDGFRFDLAATLGRDRTGAFTRDHPLLLAIVDDPVLAGSTMIAEPWDVGLGGWQTGNFPTGFSEWNDGFRDSVRDFWLRDIAAARENGSPQTGVGAFATGLAGSSNRFGPERGPLASVNFVTAHDGFTLRDLVSYDTKHNVGNGEENRDGTDDNRSFNHGVEGVTADPAVRAARDRASRNLLGTLLLSAGVPMITAGDEFGRSQNGNNNAYCHDDELTWLDWDWNDRQRALHAVARHLIQLRHANPALRPLRYARADETPPGASTLEWYDASGDRMNGEDWDAPDRRTLQYLAASTPEFEAFNRILLIVHGLETDATVTLPAPDGVVRYSLLWDSTDAAGGDSGPDAAPGDQITLSGTSLRLYRAER